MIKRFALFALLALTASSASAFEEYCQWVDYDLDTGVYGPKQYWGDTNNAYAGVIVPSGPEYVFRFNGKFPNSRYMSIESAVYLDSGSAEGLFGSAGRLQDVDDAIDRTIVPDAGSTNPFLDGASYPGSNDYYTVDAVPDGVDWESPNQITIPADYSTDYPDDYGLRKVVLISFRAISPNMDVQITPADLPTIQAIRVSDQSVVDCDPNFGPLGFASIPAFWDLVVETLNQNAVPDGDIDLAAFFDVSGPAEFIDNLRVIRGLLEAQYTTFEKWWPFRFNLVNIPFEGSAGVKGYLYGLTQMTPGNVAVIRFKAPSFLNTYSGEVETFTSRTDVRFWSMCVTDFIRGQALACMPDHMTQPDRNGYVTVVYGPDNGKVQDMATSLGYAFMADDRAPEQWEDKALSFIYRQLLPSPWFERFKLNRRSYVPKARVCSESYFLRGWCRIY